MILGAQEKVNPALAQGYLALDDGIFCKRDQELAAQRFGYQVARQVSVHRHQPAGIFDQGQAISGAPPAEGSRVGRTWPDLTAGHK